MICMLLTTVLCPLLPLCVVCAIAGHGARTPGMEVESRGGRIWPVERKTSVFLLFAAS